MKAVLLLFFISCFFACVESRQHVKADNFCDTAFFYPDNKLNDTSIVLLMQSVVFDTTACLLHGTVVDSKNGESVANASIVLKKSTASVSAKTNSNGEFEIFTEKICGAEDWSLVITKENYACTSIRYRQYIAGQFLKIKCQRIY